MSPAGRRTRRAGRAAVPETAKSAHVSRRGHLRLQTDPTEAPQKKKPAVAGGLILIWQRPTLTEPSAPLPSALRCFTSVFGMGTGGATALRSPDTSHSPSGFGPSLKTVSVIRVSSLTSAYRNRNSQTWCRNQVEREISSNKLNALLRFYPCPINVVVYNVPSGRPHLGRSLALRCFQRLSLPRMAALLCLGQDNRNTSGASIPVLSY